MENVITNPEHKTALENMQILYNIEFRNWKENCVDDEKIAKYSIIFDQDKNWDDKKGFFKKATKSDEEKAEKKAKKKKTKE